MCLDLAWMLFGSVLCWLSLIFIVFGGIFSTVMFILFMVLYTASGAIFLAENVVYKTLNKQTSVYEYNSYFFKR